MQAPKVFSPAAPQPLAKRLQLGIRNASDFGVGGIAAVRNLLAEA
ncbi:hypothetical protein [Mesorhizobium sp. AR02]|nr:hypothetical protein [Mesorhizobium sp. AR02]